MKLHIYTAITNGASKRLMDVITTNVTGVNLEAHHTIHGLAGALVQPKTHQSIVVFHVNNKEELAHAFSIRDLLHDIKLILILPGQDNRMITKGLKLYPRFFSYSDSNFKDVAAVLGKMINRSHNQLNKEGGNYHV